MDPLIDNILKADLSDISKKVYTNRLRTWQTDMGGKSLDWILKNPKPCLETLERLHSKTKPSASQPA